MSENQQHKAAEDRDAQGVRAGNGPAFLECISYRFLSHSTTARETRSAATLAEIRTRCPIQREVARLKTAGVLGADAAAALEQEAQDRVAQAFAFADASPYPDPSEVLTDVE